MKTSHNLNGSFHVSKLDTQSVKKIAQHFYNLTFQYKPLSIV